MEQLTSNQARVLNDLRRRREMALITEVADMRLRLLGDVARSANDCLSAGFSVDRINEELAGLDFRL